MFQYRKFTELIKIIAHLRSPNGCPWDKAQTHKSIVKNLIEESFELVDAIENDDVLNTKEELGDVLLQVMLHSQIAADNKSFSIDDVVEELGKKLVRRHPHVFGDKQARTEEEAHQSWLDAKALETDKNKKNTDAFNIPKHLPPLALAQKIGRKMGKEDFDWNNNQQVIQKIKEELLECTEALKEPSANPNPHLKEEIGDLLFITCQFARHNNIQADEALRGANKKIEKRYFQAKNLAQKDNHPWQSLSLDKKESYWQQVKSLK